MATRKLLAFILRVATAVGAAYVIVNAVQGYHPKSPTCLDTALQRGVENMPSYCKLPIWNFVLAFLILLVGTRIAKTLERTAA